MASEILFVQSPGKVVIEMSGLTGIGSVVGMWGQGVAVLVVVAGVAAISEREIAPDIVETPAGMSSPKVLASVATETPLESGAEVIDNTDSLASPEVDENASVSPGNAEDPSGSATVVGDTVVASVDPVEGAGVVTDSNANSTVASEGATLTKPKGPSFDLVRVDKAGGALVAGTAAPGSMAEVLIDGAAVATVKVDKRGSFVAMFDMPTAETPQIVTLEGAGTDGIKTQSSDRVIVMGRQVLSAEVADTAPAESDSNDTEVATTEPNAEEPSGEETLAPAVIIASDEGVKVIQPAALDANAPEVMDNVSLDVISYDEEGEVVLAGRSKADKHVRVYVDNQPIKTETVEADGSWQLKLPEVDAGTYVLRVDEIDAEGQVTSRLETPFLKENPEDVTRLTSLGELGETEGAVVSSSIQRITIQPGATLWALAETKYGEGNLYMQIFNANREHIRNPDLIYPGQIFQIPD